MRHRPPAGSGPALPARARGNMLIYVIGAILLFGLLIMLLKGSFSEGTGIDEDRVAIQVTEIRRFAAEVERGVNYILGNGRSESELRFAYTGSMPGYGLITDDPKRQVFAPEGGGVDYRPPPANISTVTNNRWGFYANTHIQDLGTDTLSTQKAELVMTLRDVTPAFCNAVNMSVGQNIDLTVSMDSTANGVIAAGSSMTFAGTFGSGSTVNRLEDTLFTFRPAREACIRMYDGVLVYYRVLIAR